MYDVTTDNQFSHKFCEMHEKIFLSMVREHVS